MEAHWLPSWYHGGNLILAPTLDDTFYIAPTEDSFKFLFTKSVRCLYCLLPTLPLCWNDNWPWCQPCHSCGTCERIHWTTGAALKRNQTTLSSVSTRFPHWVKLSAGVLPKWGILISENCCKRPSSLSRPGYPLQPEPPERTKSIGL